MTTEERAADYACNWSDCQDGRDDLLQCAVESYKQGATDQRKIDIDKACEWLNAHADDYIYEQYDVICMEDNFVTDFRKAMED